MGQSSYDDFQRALRAERSEGDLEKAISLYDRVVTEADDQSLAARAQLRIGMCYEKLGSKEAREAYQRVIQAYPDQQQEGRQKEEQEEKGERQRELPLAPDPGLPWHLRDQIRISLLNRLRKTRLKPCAASTPDATSIAISNGQLFLRGEEHLYCIAPKASSE